MTQRFGQLSYTSFDTGDGLPGGWQVKQTLGDLTPDEVQYLTSRVATQLDPGIALPRFPTAQQIAALPHRLRHAAATDLGPQATATWHTAPAGLDASGRPGNVFAHVVLDRGGPVLDTRPIFTWRSADWLTPYGVAEVLAASFSHPGAPRPGPLTVQNVAELVFAPRSGHLAVLQVLLDAIVAARDGGPPIVLGVADLEDAARWTAAVHLCMSPGTAQRQWFSTLERANQLNDARQLGLELIVVPVADLDDLEHVTDIVVLDAGEPVQLGDLDGSPHRTERGDEVVVTPWSVLMAEVLQDEAAFVRVSAAIDHIATEVGDNDLHPAWPVARLVADRTDLDVVEEAHRVLERYSPPGSVDLSNLRKRTSAALRRRINGDVAMAWELAQRSSAGSLEAEVYAELALADPGWLTQTGGPKLPETSVQEPSQTLTAAVIDAVARLLRASHNTATHVHQSLHVLELAGALGAPWDPDANAALAQLSSQVILPGLQDDQTCRDVVKRVDYQISDAARSWLWTLLEQHELDGRPGTRLPTTLVRWLAPRPELNEPDPLGSSPFEVSPVQLSAAAEELAWAQVSSRHTPPTTRAWAVVSALQYAVQHSDQVSVEELAALVADWPPSWLHSLHHRFGALIPVTWFLPTLLQSDEMSLWHEVAQRPDGQIGRARLRLGETTWVCQADSAQLLENIERLAVVRDQHPKIAPTVRHDITRALVVAILNGNRPDPDWLEPVSGVYLGLDAQLVAWAQRIPDVTLLWWLLHGAAELNLPSDGPWASWLDTVQVASEGKPINVVGFLLISRWQQGDPTRSANAQTTYWRTEAEEAGANFGRAIDRWLRQWAQHHRTW